MRALLRHPDCPRWAKRLLAFSLLPIPGPLDEIAGAIALGAILLRTGQPLTWGLRLWLGGVVLWLALAGELIA